MKGRSVPSRYKQAALEVSQKSNSSSDSSRASLSVEKTKSLHNNQATGFSGSRKNLSRVGITPVSSNAPNKSKYGSKSDPRMHSTAVNSSTFFEKTQLEDAEAFSNTIIGGPTGFKRNPLSSSEFLPDISAIRPSVGSSSSTASPVPTVITENPLEDDIFLRPSNLDEKSLENEEIKQYTDEEINAEYLKYLTWCYIDVASEEAFQKQVKEAQNQINFLTQLVMEEERKTAEEAEKIELLDIYEQLDSNYGLLKKELEILIDKCDPCEGALKTLTSFLESRVNQIKWENINIPEDKETYIAQINEALKENIEKLSNINLNMEAQRNALESDASHYESLEKEIKDLEKCLEKTQKAAKLSLQECSLKLSLSQ